jgi:hypothetical protein
MRDSSDRSSSAAAEEKRKEVLARWEAAINDKESLLRAPQQRIDELLVQARQAHSSGIIANDDLAELLEWADAAFAWAEEERMMDTSKLTDASEGFAQARADDT